MKANLINQLRGLLLPDNRPVCLVFRSTDNGLYTYQGQTITRAECQSMPTKIRIFVNRKSVTHHGKE